MKPVKKILAVADPTSDAQPAVARAGQLARLCKADLELYIASYYSTLTDIAADQQPAAQKVSEAMLTQLGKNLEQLADGLRRDGVSVSTRVEWRRSLHESIIEEAERCGADLIVKDTHYHTAIDRALFAGIRTGRSFARVTYRSGWSARATSWAKRRP
ncbi:MAG: universal stress protein [Woeseiaceae bacterium]|nr:universal stress protein [Woeseiaceae bacterium]